MVSLHKQRQARCSARGCPCQVIKDPRETMLLARRTHICVYMTSHAEVRCRTVLYASVFTRPSCYSQHLISDLGVTSMELYWPSHSLSNQMYGADVELLGVRVTRKELRIQDLSPSPNQQTPILPAESQHLGFIQ